MKNKKPFKGVLCLLTVILFLCSMFFTVFAEGQSVEVISYDDYAEYSLSESNGYWNMTASFPNDWPGTIVESVWGEERYKGNEFTYDLPYNFPSGITPPGMRFTITPLGIEPILYFAPDFQYTDLRLVDPTLIPKNATLSFEFDITMSSLSGSSSQVLDSLGNVLFYVAFFRPSSTGGSFELVYSDDWNAQIIEAELNANWTIHITSTFRLQDYPDYKNLAFAPFIQIVDFTGFKPNVTIDGQDYARIKFQYDSLSLNFSVTDAVKVAIDSAKGDKLLGDIKDALAAQGKQLDDFLNGDVTLDQGELGGAVDNIGNAEGELLDKVGGYLGEAPSFFSSIVSDLTQFAPAFAAVALVFNEFVSIPFVSFLLRVSIGLGILAVVLNMAISAERAGYARSRAKSVKSTGGKSSGKKSG